MPTVAEVESAIATVNAASTAAAKRLLDLWFPNSAEKAAMLELERSEPTRAGWAKTGRAAVKANIEVSGGWAGWLAMGNRLLANVKEMEGLGETLTLKAFAAELPAAAATVTTTVAKTAAKATTAVAKASADVAVSALRPLLVPLAIIVAVGVVVYVVARKVA